MENNSDWADKIGKLSKLKRARLTYESLINTYRAGTELTGKKIRELACLIMHPNSKIKKLTQHSTTMHTLINVLMNTGAIRLIGRGKGQKGPSYVICEIDIDNINNYDNNKKDKSESEGRLKLNFFKDGYLTPIQWETVVSQHKANIVKKIKDFPISKLDCYLFDTLLEDPFTKKLYRCTGIYQENGKGRVRVIQYKKE